MEGIVELLLSFLLLCAASGNSHSVWYEDNGDISVCEKPCVDPSQCIADIKCEDDQVVQNNVTVCGCCPGCVPHNITGPCNPKDSTVTWKPSCESNGTYKAVQCKGDDRCFCTPPDSSTRIFGFQWFENSENMTCACSRYVWELKKNSGRKDITIHCTEGGDFDELQCDNHICWCADPRTGNPQTRVVPETMMKLLPCYDETKVGTQYLRQCESYAVAKARIDEAFLQHGTTIINLDYINCDYDGSYGFKQSDGTTCYCAWKDGSRIGSWASQATEIANVDCNCARDTKYKEGTGRKNLVCLPNGNYQPSQGDGADKICVDKDGYTIKMGDCAE
ncbi:uncharacterized protein [Anabrus simplex]|uniref:uncharacterized protein n=1 Tax=Anabrus simplex TaxID=316456 RepID=UPI0035A26ABA